MSAIKKIQIAIVGAGPRGTSCLERICASVQELLHRDGKLTIHVVDPYPPGPGRVWRQDQPPQLLMNTVASQITVFTDAKLGCKGPHDEKHWGPSLYEWGKDEDGFRLDKYGYSTRVQNGLYLGWAFHEISRKALKENPFDIDIQVHSAKAVKLEDELESESNTDSATQALTLDKPLASGQGSTLKGLSAVILTQGHLDQRLDEKQKEFLKHVDTMNRDNKAEIRYFPPNNPTNIDLEAIDAIKAGETVLLRGLGLFFFDYMILLTTRRGGWFKRMEDGSFKYYKSGKEPTIYAGSRRGIPYHAKAANKIADSSSHTSRFLTSDVIAELKRKAQERNWPKFKEEVWPLISQEVKLVYYKTLLGKPELEEDLVRILQSDCDSEEKKLGELGVANRDMWSWNRLEKPQGSKRFDSIKDWNDWLLTYLENDAEDAKQGDVKAPRMAALNVFRVIRKDLRSIINHRGLETESYKKDLVGWFTPFVLFLSAGPPCRRIEQMIALMKAGVLTILGPRLEAHPCPDGWLAKSENPDCKQIVNTVIDSYHSPTKLDNTADELLQDLLKNKECQAHRIGDHETGAIDIGEESYNIIKAGKPHPRRFAIGVPAEGVHWLTNDQPSPLADSINLHQTDAIARAALTVAAKDRFERE